MTNKYKNNPLWISLIIIVGFLLVQCGDKDKLAPILPDSNEKHLYAGQPVASNSLKRIDRIGYVVGYDEKRKNPAWVAYYLAPVEKKPQGISRRPSKFNTDMTTEAKVSHQDYTHSGYDRGHMAPNYGISTRYGRQAQLETFLMSNIVPQKGNLNRGVWRELEMKVADIKGGIANRVEGVYVITGPIYDDKIEKIKDNIEIPDSFYKIIVDLENKIPRTLAFIMPQDANRKDEPEKFLTSIDEIEKQTGLDFFADMQDSYESKFEAKIAKQIW